jgi:beta-glucosidase
MQTMSLPEATSKQLGSSSSGGSGRPTMKFPKDFLWGVSTAAHQVEGGNDNQWSAWEAAGRIRSGDSCGGACDWWNNPEQDFDLAQRMGLNALRLSVEWSRIEPEPNRWDLQALSRYGNALRGLLRRGIQPIVCLHHFTHPRWFEADGAFLSPRASMIFERFTRRVVQDLGDLCQQWVTFNEPNVYAALGYVLGEFPPGTIGEIGTAVRVANAMARAHAQAYRAIHELQQNARVGWAHNYVVFEPANHRSRLDRWTARLLSQLFNEIFLSAVENGKLEFPLNLADGDVGSAHGTCDFVGLNVYSRFHVAFSAEKSSQLFADVFVPEDVPQGDSGVEKPYGEAYPEAIGAAVRRAARLKKPIYILENGVPDAHDRIRPWLLVNAVKQVYELLGDGYDIRGYFHWTLIDNFEWTEGWNLRFGLVALDPSTQKRTLRPSAELYSSIVRANALSPDLLERFGLVAPAGRSS